MVWSRHHREPPGTRRLPENDQPPTPSPLLTRRSRIAAWGAIPIALAGCQLATYFLNQIVLNYHLR